MWKTFLLTEIAIRVSLAITGLRDLHFFHKYLGKNLRDFDSKFYQIAEIAIFCALHSLWKTFGINRTNSIFQ